jgi:hypothetical protein
MKKRASKGGRPATPPSKLKSAVILIRVNDAEKARIRAAAENSGNGISAWIRDRVLAVADRELAAKAEQ